MESKPEEEWYTPSLLNDRDMILQEILNFFTEHITDAEKILELTSLWGGDEASSFRDVWDVFEDCPFTDESELKSSLEALKDVFETTLLSEGFLDTSAIKLLPPIVSTLKKIIKDFQEADDAREKREFALAIESVKRKRSMESTDYGAPTGKRRR